MFKIYDGRSEFYQWDLDRKIVLSDPTIKEVHFCNKTSDCSLITEVYEKDGLHLADVPNILLQTDWPIHVYAYCGECYTKTSTTFKVNKRSRPDDYVYTETDVLNYRAILERMESVEKCVEEIELMPGPRGDSGVYVGASEPTDASVLVWIDTAGEANVEPAEGGSY